MRWVVFIFCLLITGISYAQNCVIEGAWMGNSPGSLSRCCEGLQLMPPPPGQLGSRGQCLKKENNQFCLGENLSGLNYPGAVDKCCQGLTKMGPAIHDPRIRFVCKKLPSCVPENETISLNPAYTKPCCEGLEAVFIDDGRVGAGRTCVKKSQVNCVREGVPLFQYPGSPSCCEGLVGRNASPNSPVTFAQVCTRGTDNSRINNTEARKELSIDPEIGMPDSEVTGQ